MAGAIASLRGFDVARPLFEKCLSLLPDDADLHEEYGFWLAESRDRSCVHHLEKAMELNRMKSYGCCRKLVEYFSEELDEESAKRYLELAQGWLYELANAQVERSAIAADDRFKEHSAGEDSVGEICDVLCRVEQVRRAYLVEKELRLFPESPVYILLLELKTGLLSNNEKRHALVEMVGTQCEFPGAALIISMEDAPSTLARYALRSKRALIFSRDR